MNSQAPDDLACMQRCRELASLAAERQESPVGSLVVLMGRIIGEGMEASKNKRDVTCHAEVEAIRAAVNNHGQDLSGAVLYTTHEPCILCSYIIRHHRVSRVVIEREVAHIGGASSAYPILTTEDIPIWGPPPVVHWLG